MEYATNDFLLKNFIFLDMDFLESFTAQKYKGFPTEMQTANILESATEENGEKIGDENTISRKISGGVL